MTFGRKKSIFDGFDLGKGAMKHTLNHVSEFDWMVGNSDIRPESLSIDDGMDKPIMNPSPQPRRTPRQKRAFKKTRREMIKSGSQAITDNERAYSDSIKNNTGYYNYEDQY